MEKVIIISYFFKPCNLTAANRAYGWAKYLQKYGYYPIIITRSWEVEIKTPNDVLKSSGRKLDIVKRQEYEVHYLPYKSNLRDRINQNKKLVFISKFLTFFGLVLQNFTTFFIPYKNIYSHSLNYLKNNPDIKKVIITANPFNLFYFGYKLKKELNIKWIADYRDDWTTSELHEYKPLSNFSLINFLDKNSEKKWVSSSSLITSVSEHYQRKISNFVNVKGVEIINGFIDTIRSNQVPKRKRRKTIHITYNGSLYDSQNIELFLEALLELKDENSNFNFKFNFPGLSFSKKQKKRVLDFVRGYESFFNITNRISREDVIKMQLDSDILLMIGHDKLIGIPSSKVYEYISLKKPILLVESDSDILQKTIKESGLGLIANNKSKIKQILTEVHEKLMIGEKILVRIDEKKIDQFSRKYSTKKLASYLDKI